MTLKFYSRSIIWGHSGSHTQREVKNAPSSLVYESERSWNHSQVGHLQRAFEY